MEFHSINFDTVFAFLTLTALEIALGIDNIIFISVLSNRLPKDLRNRARRFGLLFALISRISLLLDLSWVISLSQPIFTIFWEAISGKKLLLFSGGLFLLWKAAREIYLEVEAPERPSKERNFRSGAILSAGHKSSLLWGTILQIGLLDMVFSLDSVITAVGLVNQIPIMISAILASILIMLITAQVIGDFVYRHPSIKTISAVIFNRCWSGTHFWGYGCSNTTLLCLLCNDFLPDSWAIGNQIESKKNKSTSPTSRAMSIFHSPSPSWEWLLRWGQNR